jgi:adenylate cyclase
MKGFSSVTEGMAPESVMEWLNLYMDAMTRLIMQYGGVIDRFAGDGIKADFGIPIPRRTEQEIGRDAVRAVDCALAMGHEMERLTLLLKERRLPDTQIRVGIFTGSAIAGTIGSAERMQYTTLGDSVNIAARLESYDKTLAKESPCRILIGESTLKYTGERFRTEKIGEAGFKGMQKRVTIYRVLGLNPIRVPVDQG